MGQLLVVTNGYERLPFSLNVNIELVGARLCVRFVSAPKAVVVEETHCVADCIGKPVVEGGAQKDSHFPPKPVVEFEDGAVRPGEYSQSILHVQVCA